MKKNIVLIIMSIISTVILVLTIGNFLLNNKMKKISENIEINLDKCKIDKSSDSHGVFLSDGDYFVKITCSDINYEELSNNWKELPLTKSLIDATTLKKCNNKTCQDIYEEYSIPNISNGYYYFIDRHNDSKNKYDDSELNNRSSYNYTLALLDKDTNIIYYYELDT